MSGPESSEAGSDAVRLYHLVTTRLAQGVVRAADAKTLLRDALGLRGMPAKRYAAAVEFGDRLGWWAKTGDLSLLRGGTQPKAPAGEVEAPAGEVARYAARSRELAALVVRLHEQLAARANAIEEALGEVEGNGEDLDVHRHPERVRDALERAVQVLSAVHGAQSCRLCGCTEFWPCETESGPCGWAAQSEHGLECTACVGLDAGDLPIEEPHPDRSTTTLTVIEPAKPTWPVMLDRDGGALPASVPLCHRCQNEAPELEAVTLLEERSDPFTWVARRCVRCREGTEWRIPLGDLVSDPVTCSSVHPMNGHPCEEPGEEHIADHSYTEGRIYDAGGIGARVWWDDDGRCRNTDEVEAEIEALQRGRDDYAAGNRKNPWTKRKDAVRHEHWQEGWDRAAEKAARSAK